MSANSSTNATARKRLTVNDLALIVANLGNQVQTLVDSQAQHSTPAPVAEITAPVVQLVTPVAPAPAPAPVVKATPASVAGDQLMAFVESKGLAFARGGRTHLDRDALSAIARVLKTGTSEVVTIKREALTKRGIVGLAIGLDGEGGVITQYAFNPSATRS